MFGFVFDRPNLCFDVFENFLMEFEGVLFGLVGLLAATLFAHMDA